MKILNIRFDNLYMKEAINQAVALLKKKKSNIFFLNSDCLFQAQKDMEYRKILNKSALLLSDGIGLKFSMAILGGKLKDNCNGTDFSPLLLKELAKKKAKVFFLGAKPGIAEKAAKNISKKIPSLNIVGTNDGYFKDDNKIIRKINNSKADVLFVAMGVPKQEKWIYKNRNKLNPKICIGVGALLDFLSGNVSRAPIIVRKLKLEWSWRLMNEPKRLFKRYIIDTPKLFIITISARLKGEKIQDD